MQSLELFVVTDRDLLVDFVAFAELAPAVVLDESRDLVANLELFRLYTRGKLFENGTLIEIFQNFIC